MKKPNVYFASGAGGGKTYCARYLIEKYGYIQSKIANPVYDLCRQYFGMVNKNRKLLQFLGTDVGRKLVSDNIWVDRFMQDIFIVEETYKQLYNKEVSFVSDDCRFRNEHKALKEMGWIGIYLSVPEEIRLKRLTSRDGDAQVKNLTHVSETELETFKDELITVDSSGTLEQTYQNLEETLEYIRKEKSEATTN